MCIFALMDRFLTFLLSAVLSLTIAAENHPFDKLDVKQYSIDSAWPTSLRSVKGKASISVDNSGDRRDVTGISAVVYRKGERFAEGACDDVCFEKGEKTYSISGTVSLAEGISVWQAIGAALSFRPSEYTIDICAVMKHENGSVEQIERLGVPATRFLK